MDTQTHGEPCTSPGDVSPAAPGAPSPRALPRARPDAAGPGPGLPPPPSSAQAAPGNGVSRANRRPSQLPNPTSAAPRGAPWILPLWPGSGSLLPPGSSDGKAVRRSRTSCAFSHPPRTPKGQIPPWFGFLPPDGGAPAGSLPGAYWEVAVDVEKLPARSWGKFPGRLGENSKSLTPNQIPWKSCSSSRRRCGGGAGRRSFCAVRVPKLCAELACAALQNSCRRDFQGTFSRENRYQRGLMPVGPVAMGVQDRG